MGGMCFLRGCGAPVPPSKTGETHLLCIFQSGLLGEQLPAAATAAASFGSWNLSFFPAYMYLTIGCSNGCLIPLLTFPGQPFNFF